MNNKPSAYNLVINEGGKIALKVLINGFAMFVEEKPEILEELMNRQDAKFLEEFISEVSDKNHQTFGCQDPNCSWDSKNKGVSQGTNS